MNFQIRKAVKQQLRARIGLVGPAGSGKTYTALAMAEGLGQRVLVIDTENGSSERYAARFSFDILPLPDYSPETYAKALEQRALAEYDVVIVDSLSHAWSGQGGALELVDQAAKKSYGANKFAGWADVTPLHNRMIEALLRCPAHLIVTMRSKTAYELVDDGNGRKKPVKIGLAPVQRDGMEYEFDLVGDLDHDHNLAVTKCRYLDLMLPNGRPVDGNVVSKPGREFGRSIDEWLNEGVDREEVERRQAEAAERERKREFIRKIDKGRQMLADIEGHRICAEWCALTGEVLDLAEESKRDDDALPLRTLLKLGTKWTAEQRVDTLAHPHMVPLAKSDRLRVAWAKALLVAVADCDDKALRERASGIAGICTHDELVELASKVVDVQPSDRVERLRHLLAVLESAAKVDAMDASNDDREPMEVTAVRMGNALRQVDELTDVDDHTRTQWKAVIQTASDDSVFAAVDALRIGDALVSAQERVDLLRAQIARIRGEAAGSTEAA